MITKILDQAQSYSNDHLALLGGRAENLRECTAEENAWNRMCKREPEKVGNKWRSRVDFKGRRINFGSFNSYELAKNAMMEGVKCLHKEFFRDE